MNDQVNETNNLTSTDKNGTNNKSDLMDESVPQKRQKNFQIETPSMYRELCNSVTVLVSFNTLPIYIDELWKTFIEIGGEAFKEMNTLRNKDIFKKVMLILAEAKVCCAQRFCSHKLDEELPQKGEYFYEELTNLNSLVELLPYPLAIYLDCLGNTMEGKLNLTPVLAKLDAGEKAVADAISCAPRQLIPFLRLLRQGVDENGEAHKLAAQLKVLPGFKYQILNRKVYLTIDSFNFWLTEDERISLHISEIQIFRDIIKCFDKKGFNIPTDLLNGQGSLAQTVQTPQWFIDRPFRYFCMADISAYEQKLGAFFGFSYTFGHKVQASYSNNSPTSFGSFYSTKVQQASRYVGDYKAAYWHGEMVPEMMMKSILDHKKLCSLQEVLD